MYPTQLLVLMLLLTAGVLAWQVRSRARRGAMLRGLADRTGMHYSPRDRFGLAARVAREFPVPGVADVRVSDLLYRSDDAGHRYVFTAVHTAGVVGAKRRVRSVVLLTESRATSEHSSAAAIEVADPGEPVLAQYESLVARTEGAATAADPGAK